MATVRDYLDAQKQAQRSIETLKRRVRGAYDAAQATTNNGTYDCLDELVDDAVRGRFKNTLISSLAAPIQAMINGTPEDRIFQEALAMNGFYGFTGEQLRGLVDGAKDKLTFEGFWDYLGKKTRFGEVQQVRYQAPGSVLDQVTTPDVVNYVGIAPTQPDLITLQDKAELINWFEEYGVVPPNLIKNKPYMKP